MVMVVMGLLVPNNGNSFVILGLLTKNVKIMGLVCCYKYILNDRRVFISIYITSKESIKMQNISWLYEFKYCFSNIYNYV